MKSLFNQISSLTSCMVVLAAAAAAYNAAPRAIAATELDSVRGAAGCNCTTTEKSCPANTIDGSMGCSNHNVFGSDPWIFTNGLRPRSANGCGSAPACPVALEASCPGPC